MSSASPAAPHSDGNVDEQVSLSPIWERAGRLLDQTDDVSSLLMHGVEMLAVWRRRSLGLPVPDELAARDRLARATQLATSAMLERIAAAYGEPFVMIKGPELASFYPDESRRFGDLDLLVTDAPRAQQALLDAGFVEINDPELYKDIHHMRPLMWPTLPLKVELHMRPKWPEGFAAPAAAEIFKTATEKTFTGQTVLVPSRLHHSLLVAAHAWAHVPLRALRDLIDLAAVSEDVGRAELGALAHSWAIERIWNTSIAATDALFMPGHRETLPLRTWARHIRQARERTVFEAHLESWFSPFSAFPVHRAVSRSLRTMVRDLGRAKDETWGDKGHRTARAILNASVPRSQHDRSLGDAASRRR